MKKIELFLKEKYLNLKKQMLPLDNNSMKKTLEFKLLALTKEELIILELQRKVVIKFNHINGDIRMCQLSSLLE